MRDGRVSSVGGSVSVLDGSAGLLFDIGELLMIISRASLSHSKPSPELPRREGNLEPEIPLEPVGSTVGQSD